jgi:amino acid transporter
VSLYVQLFAGILFVFLGQAGTSVKGAYDVLVSMGIITYFIPYLYVFASMFKVQNERAGPEVIRVPGGKPVARFIACVGFATTLFTIAISFVPSSEETNKVLAVIKVVGLSAVLIGTGWLLYFLGNRKRNASVTTV